MDRGLLAVGRCVVGNQSGKPPRYWETVYCRSTQLHLLFIVGIPLAYLLGLTLGMGAEGLFYSLAAGLFAGGITSNIFSISTRLGGVYSGHSEQVSRCLCSTRVDVIKMYMPVTCR